MSRRLPKKDVVIVGLGWTGAIMAQELTEEGLEVIAIERGPWRDAPTDFPPTYMQDELRYRIRHELFLSPDQNDLHISQQVESEGATDSFLGRFHAPQWRRRRRGALERRNMAFPALRFRAEEPSHAALRREIPASRHDHPGLGRQPTMSSSRTTTVLSICAARQGHRGKHQGNRFRRAATRLRGRARARIRLRRKRSPSAITLFAKAARELGYKPFPQPSGESLHALSESAGSASGAMHVLRLL